MAGGVVTLAIASPGRYRLVMLGYLRSVSTVAIAVWLGSLAHMLLTVATLFSAFPKINSTVAVDAAPVVFHATERALLVVALVAIAGTVAWLYETGARSLKWIVSLLFIASVLALIQAFAISARMDAIRIDGHSGGESFRFLHHLSSAQYLVQTGLVLIAAIILPAASRGSAGRESVGLDSVGREKA